MADGGRHYLEKYMWMWAWGASKWFFLKMVVGPHLHSPGMWCKCSTLQRRPRGCLPVAEKSSCDGWALIGKEGSGKSSSTCKICQTNQQPSTHHVCVFNVYWCHMCTHTHTHTHTHTIRLTWKKQSLHTINAKSQGEESVEVDIKTIRPLWHGLNGRKSWSQ